MATAETAATPAVSEMATTEAVAAPPAPPAPAAVPKMAAVETAVTSNNLQDRSMVWKTVRPFLIGGLSASSATCCIQPIDMVKVRIQLQSGKVNANPVNIAATMLRTEGVTVFYRGLSAAIFRQLTYGMTRLGVFRTLTNRYTPEGKTAADIDFLTKVGCSLTAGGIGALVGTPAEVALIRMQADTVCPEAERRGYKNVIDALLRIGREEGLNGFFTGATPTIVRGLSINLGMLMTYDQYKKWNSTWAGDGTQTNRFFSGFLSGWTAATVSLPFDFIKTRLQKQAPLPDGTMPYKGVLDCMRKVAAEEGIGAFYQGYFTFVVRIAPHIMLTWVFMDNVKGMLDGMNM